MLFFRKNRHKKLLKATELLHSITVFIERGLLSVDAKKRTVAVHDSLWDINDERSKKNYARNLAVYIASFNENSKEISATLFSMQSGKKIAAFENDKALLF